MQGREREIDTLSVRRPQPHTTNYQPIEEKKRKGKYLKTKKERATRPTKMHWPLETRQSHTIEYGVNQIVPERY